MGLLLRRFGELWDWIWIPREVAREIQDYLVQHSDLISRGIPACRRPLFRDDLARVGDASAGPITVRFFGFVLRPAER